jgi:ribosomal protein L11 methyltransferase
MTYQVYEFFTSQEAEQNLLIAVLSENGFDSFEENNDSLKAYIPESILETTNVIDLLKEYGLDEIEFKVEKLEQKNWNEEWEKNFEPVIIAEKVGIRAPFHAPMSQEIELIIEPKMSFGTGHHHTTALMIEQMLSIDFKDKSVLDFGSGTGVLAILASKLGASKIIAIDNEEWAYENCKENSNRNDVENINAIHGDDTLIIEEQFDILLANINRNVILKNITQWSNLVLNEGILMVSGILLSDEADILNAAQQAQLKNPIILRKEGWLAISFKK